MQPLRPTSPIFQTDEDIHSLKRQNYKICKQIFRTQGSLHVKEVLDLTKSLEDAYDVVYQVFDKMRDYFCLNYTYVVLFRKYYIYSFKISNQSKVSTMVQT